MTITNRHANATAAIVGTGPAVLVVLVARRLGLNLSPDEAAAVGGGIISLVLLVGREGVVGILRGVLYGNSAPVAKTGA